MSSPFRCDNTAQTKTEEVPWPAADASLGVDMIMWRRIGDLSDVFFQATGSGMNSGGVQKQDVRLQFGSLREGRGKGAEVICRYM